MIDYPKGKGPKSPIGIVSAIRPELSSVIESLQGTERIKAAGRSFYLGNWHERDIVAVFARVGKVAAATTAVALIERFGVTSIVFTGVAGGLGPEVKIGDVVIARQFMQHDLDASPLFPRFEVPLYNQSRFGVDSLQTDQLVLATRQALAKPEHLIAHDALEPMNLTAPQLHEGLIVSGDQFIASASACAALRRDIPDALAVEMEGAAIAQVCHDYKIGLAAVRIISDRADEQAHQDFTKFIEAVASRYSFAILDAFVSSPS